MSKVIAFIASLFGNSTQAKRLIFIFVLLLILAIFAVFGARCAHADEISPPYVQLSAGSTYVRGPAPVLDLGWAFPAGLITHDFWKADLTVIGQSTYEGQPAPNNFALRGLYVAGFRYLDIGLGLAWMQNPAPYNGSPVNFTLELAYRFQRLPVTFTVSHMSNAGSREPNLGRDFLTIGLRKQL